MSGFKSASITPVTELVASAQNFTGAWSDLGPEIDCRGFAQIALYVSIDINDTEDARIRALAKHTLDDSDEYCFPIATASSSDIAIEDEYVELTDDADQKLILQWETNNVVPWIQFQIEAGTVGGSAGNVASAYAVKGYGD